MMAPDSDFKFDMLRRIWPPAGRYRDSHGHGSHGTSTQAIQLQVASEISILA
jgi:hypothetical protein